jgi:hypothetical protein
MRRERCTITARLAGPCACCRQPAWPAHVRGFEVYCEACCGCGRGGAQAPGRGGRDLAGSHSLPCRPGPGHDALAAHRGPAKNRPKTGLPAGAGASPGHGWWGSTGRPEAGPAEAVSGPTPATVRAGLPACRTHAGAAGAAARGRPPRPHARPARTHCHAATPCRPRADAAASQSVATMPPALAGPARGLHTQVCAAKCAANLTSNWR